MTRIREAIGLLNSMVLTGERPSIKSSQLVTEALAEETALIGIITFKDAELAEKDAEIKRLREGRYTENELLTMLENVRLCVLCDKPKTDRCHAGSSSWWHHDHVAKSALEEGS